VKEKGLGNEGIGHGVKDNDAGEKLFKLVF
jgi:hypothetical protein